MQKHLISTNNKLWTVTELGLTDLCKMANTNDIYKYTQLDAQAKHIIWSSLSKVMFKSIYHLQNAKLIWDRLSDIHEGYRTRQDPMFIEYKNFLKSQETDQISSSSSMCLMAKGSKVLKHHSSSESSECESDENLKPSYSKLANIATKQQTSLEKLQKLLDKSDDPLNEEMDRIQTLTKGLQSLQSKFDNLQSHHDALLVDHEKLSYEFLQRKQDLEKLRVSHEDIQRDNDYLLAQ